MLFLATQIAVIATGLVAGVFLTFSDFIMRSLTAAQPWAGAEAMQLINRKVYGSAFLVLLMGMAALSAALIWAGAVVAPDSASIWLGAGGAAYLTAVFGTTVVGNVPMNKRLDTLSLDDPATVLYWRAYARRWTQLNHIRTGGAIASTISYLIALSHL